MKLDKCPKCGSRILGDHWTAHRKLQQYCASDEEAAGCDWEGVPRTPETIYVDRVKTVSVKGYWYFDIYDKYGRIAMISRGYSLEQDAALAMAKELRKGVDNVDAGPYRAILWPPTTTVVGQYYEY